MVRDQLDAHAGDGNARNITGFISPNVQEPVDLKDVTKRWQPTEMRTK